MPFTPAHPAIVVPLLYKGRRWLSATGLILGSMSPDFEYFLRLRSGGGFGHSVVGIFLLDLPLVLLVAALFHALVKRPLVRSLPALLRRRLGRFAEQQWPLRNLLSLRLLLGAVVGAGSHLAWDGVTHTRGRIAHQLPGLAYSVHDLPVFMWLQYGSSAVGLLVMAWFVWRLPATHTRRIPARQQALFWLVTGALFGVFLIIFSWYGYRFYQLELHVAASIASISAGSLAVVLGAAFLRLTAIGRPDTQPSYTHS